MAQEEPEQFEAFRSDLMADLTPEGMIERELVDRLAGLLWRLRRIPVLEAELLNAPGPSTVSYNLANLSSDELEQLAALLRKAGVVNVPPPRLEEVKGQDGGEKQMDKLPRRAEMLIILSRYEMGLMNAVTRTFSLLHGLRTARMVTEEDARTVNN